MTLDTRAARAKRSIDEATASATPAAMRSVAGRRRVSLYAGLAGVVAMAFAAVALAATLPILTPSSDNVAGIPITDSGDFGDLAGPVLHRTVTDSPEPYALFSGHNAPGTVVTASSEYGVADLVVGESGEWVLKLWLQSPPPGEEFPIALTVGGEEFVFGFTSLWDPANIDITAHQSYGISDDAHPYEKFFGTAPPGTPVIATSEYGSADAVAGEEGHWSLALWFVEPPMGEGFPITVKVGEEVFSFSFVWLHKTDVPPIDVTVVQHGTSSESPEPYTIFTGTAPKGTHIKAVSEFGSADTEVGESGEFELKLRFHGAPAGVTFPIKVKVNGELFGEYHFTSYYEPPTAEVTVHQYNTASDDPYPWVKFYGTAPKGTHIQILSPYGSWGWHTEAVEWNSGPKYFTPMPPAGETFNITVKVNGEVFGVYPFTSWFEGDQVLIEVVNTSSESPEPYTKVEFWAPAGTTIKLISEYGSSQTTTVETGGGYLKLWFSELPPAGVPFTVSIKVNGDLWDTYQFTSWYEGGEVTVNHAYFECSEADPYDDLWGTAPAGTHIFISSPYGSAELTVGESGTWEKRVYFNGAPYGEPFLVKVKVNGSVHTSYEFTVNEPA